MYFSIEPRLSDFLTIQKGKPGFEAMYTSHFPNIVLGGALKKKVILGHSGIVLIFILVFFILESSSV